MQIGTQQMIQFRWSFPFVMVNPDRDDAGHQRTEQTAGIILRDGEKVVISQFFPNIDRNIFIMKR